MAERVGFWITFHAKSFITHRIPFFNRRLAPLFIVS